MTIVSDSKLQSAIEKLALPGVSIGHRLIALGDEEALLPEEAPGISDYVVERRRASGAARIVARELLGRFGHPDCALPRAPSGAPIWPVGVIGSLAHDRLVAVAAIAMRRRVGALGIDVEPAEPLPNELLDIVATFGERLTMSDEPCAGRLLFAAKEAVFKAVHPLDGMFLEHHDVHIDLSRGKGVVCNGRVVELRYCIASHLIAVAYLPTNPGLPG